MAFQSSSAAVTSTQNENWKAQGFLNLYLPSKDGKGGRRKLGAIPLKDSKPAEKQLLAWLNEDPTRVSIIMSKLVMEYQSASAGDAAAFDL